MISAFLKSLSHIKRPFFRNRLPDHGSLKSTWIEDPHRPAVGNNIQAWRPLGWIGDLRFTECSRVSIKFEVSRADPGVPGSRKFTGTA